jgi:hypothetical protein
MHGTTFFIDRLNQTGHWVDIIANAGSAAISGAGLSPLSFVVDEKNLKKKIINTGSPSDKCLLSIGPKVGAPTFFSYNPFGRK